MTNTPTYDILAKQLVAAQGLIDLCKRLYALLETRQMTVEYQTVLQEKIRRVQEFHQLEQQRVVLMQHQTLDDLPSHTEEEKAFIQLYRKEMRGLRQHLTQLQTFIDRDLARVNRHEQRLSGLCALVTYNEQGERQHDQTVSLDLTV